MGAFVTIGLFGGTFDPVHFGHLFAAIQLKEKCDLKEVWVIPANVPPLKRERNGAEDRLEMAKRAFSDIPGFKVLDLEFKRQGPSFTIDTIKEILKKFPHERFALLLGQDAVLQFPEWKDPEEIVALLPLLVAARSGYQIKNKIADFSPELRAAIEKGVVETPMIDIDATNVRKRLKERLYCGHLVPGKVLDFIYENQLYFNA